MLCKFIKIQKNIYKCTVCKKELISVKELIPNKILSICKPCKYKNNVIRTETCPSCSGNISIKIFSCTLHKECCLSNKLPLIKNCNTCEDYELPKPT